MLKEFWKGCVLYNSVYYTQPIVVVQNHARQLLVKPFSPFCFQLPPSEFHNVHTVSDVPSCYMYVFINTTDIEFQKNFTEYEQFVNNTKNCAGM